MPGCAARAVAIAVDDVVELGDEEFDLLVG
jgi:hypothetical protein